MYCRSMLPYISLKLERASFNYILDDFLAGNSAAAVAAVVAAAAVAVDRVVAVDYLLNVTYHIIIFILGFSVII